MTAQVAFLFPGQGSQAVGMGADIFEASPAAQQVFEAVDGALGISLSDLCFHGPEDALRETINAQPAIVTVSLALLAAFQERATVSTTGISVPQTESHKGPLPTPPHPRAYGTPAPAGPWASPLTPSYTAGHSVGEYAALVAAGALDLESAARLVRERGRLMHAEGMVCPGGMAAIIGMDGETLEGICQEATAQALAELAKDGRSKTHPGQGQVAVANFNAPGQIVISGEQHALALAMELAKARGAKRVIPLAVSGAFHSPVMQPAAAGLARAIEAADAHNAAIPIIGNIDARPLTEGEAIRAELAQQISSPVQWIRTIEYLTSAGVTVLLEIGPGSALTGMIKRIAKGVTTINIGNVVEIEKAVSTVREMGLLSEV